MRATAMRCDRNRVSSHEAKARYFMFDINSGGGCGNKSLYKRQRKQKHTCHKRMNPTSTTSDELANHVSMNPWRT